MQEHGQWWEVTEYIYSSAVLKVAMIIIFILAMDHMYVKGVINPQRMIMNATVPLSYMCFNSAFKFIVLVLGPAHSLLFRFTLTALINIVFGAAVSS